MSLVTHLPSLARKSCVPLSKYTVTSLRFAELSAPKAHRRRPRATRSRPPEDAPNTSTHHSAMTLGAASVSTDSSSPTPSVSTSLPFPYGSAAFSPSTSPPKSSMHPPPPLSPAGSVGASCRVYLYSPADGVWRPQGSAPRSDPDLLARPSRPPRSFARDVCTECAITIVCECECVCGASHPDSCTPPPPHRWRVMWYLAAASPPLPGWCRRRLSALARGVIPPC